MHIELENERPQSFAEPEEEGPHLGSFAEATHWQKDNANIQHGYRINYKSARRALRSCFEIHNETGNIWTHVLGFAMAGVFLYVALLRISAVSGMIDKINRDFGALFAPLQDALQRQLAIQHSFSNSDATLRLIAHSLERLPVLGRGYGANYLDLEGNYSLTLSHLSAGRIDDAHSLRECADNFTSLQGRYLRALTQSLALDWVEIYDESRETEHPLNREQLRAARPQHVPVWPIVVMIISSFMCFGNSAIYHTFFCMSETHNKYLLRVDYGCICFIIAGGATPLIYYSFFCDPQLQAFYLGFVYTVCFSTFVISIFDYIHREENRKLKGKHRTAAAAGLRLGGDPSSQTPRRNRETAPHRVRDC